MAEYPYTTVIGKIKPLLSKIREVGVPTKATVKWLKSLGFTSSNDATLLPVLRFIGLVDTSSTPTEAWKKYRGANHGQVLANSIREGYSDMFAVYPDAHARNASEIEHVISTSSTAGKQAITKTVRTFQNLCAEALFTAAGAASPPPPPGVLTQVANPTPPGLSSAGSPSLHIDIQVHISPDATPDQIDKIFESMAKHLYKQKK